MQDLGGFMDPIMYPLIIDHYRSQGYGWLTTEELIWGDAEHPWVKVRLVQTTA